MIWRHPWCHKLVTLRHLNNRLTCVSLFCTVDISRKWVILILNPLEIRIIYFSWMNGLCPLQHPGQIVWIHMNINISNEVQTIKIMSSTTHQAMRDPKCSTNMAPFGFRHFIQTKDDHIARPSSFFQLIFPIPIVCVPWPTVTSTLISGLVGSRPRRHYGNMAWSSHRPNIVWTSPPAFGICLTVVRGII